MKIITFNIWIKINNCDAVIDFLMKENADIICLQEVSRTEGWTIPMYNKKERIDNELWVLYPRRFRWGLFATTSLWTSARVVGGIMEQGNYILSKYPIIEWKHKFYHQSYRQITDRSDRRENDHGRALTCASLQTDLWDIFVANVHWCRTKDKTWTPRTMQQINSITEICASKEKVLLLWDFNLLPHTKEIQHLSELYTNAGEQFKLMTTRPDFDDWLDKWNQIVDYVFSSSQLNINSCTTKDISISDHLPIICTITQS
jgi:endonuclease/exonuclease/phosphatase family metal-dependent hydrolase